MFRQEQLASIIDFQQKHFLNKDLGIIRLSLDKIPIVNSYATIITGVRRCGKSTLLLQLLKQKYEEALYFNFEDIRLAGFETSDLIRLRDEIERRKIKVLFFDEIQIIGKWEIFIHQMLQEDYTIFITGSNASLLSREMGTHLTGRHLSMELFPFSYTEYLRYKKQAPGVKSLINYLNTGGIPAYVKNKNRILLTSLADDILIKDIAVRHSVRDVESLRQLMVFLVSNIGNLVSANKLAGMFGIKSSATILEYFSYLTNSYLIEFVPQFSYSYKAQVRNPKKIYAIDTGMVTEIAAAFTGNDGHKLENLVYLELRRKHKDIFFYKEKGECDFVVFDRGSAISAIQVCYSIDDINFDREYNGLMEAMAHLQLTNGIIVTLNQKDRFVKDGYTIEMLPAHEFLTLNS